MEKYKFLVYNPKNMESEYRESSVSDELVKKLDEVLNSFNNDNITVSPLVIDPDDLSVRWSIIEKINGVQRLTHYVSLKNRNS